MQQIPQPGHEKRSMWKINNKIKETIPGAYNPDMVKNC